MTQGQIRDEWLELRPMLIAMNLVIVTTDSGNLTLTLTLLFT